MTEATAKLVTDNLGLATYRASKFQGRGVAMEDLIQEARIGLCEAAKTFNAEISKFSTWAVWKMQKYLQLATRSRHEVSIPEYLFRYFPTIDRVKIILGPAASDREVVDYCNKNCPDSKVNPADAIAAMRALSCSSLNVATGDRIANLPDQRSTINTVDVGAYLGTLSDREREVVTLRYGLDDGNERTLQEIGDELGLSKERIRQIENGAMKKMQEVA